MLFMLSLNAKDNSITEIREFVNDNNLGVKGRSSTIIMNRINDLMKKRTQTILHWYCQQSMTIPAATITT